jgi:glycosyltransferase involved in cell wall biosynthesis
MHLIKHSVVIMTYNQEKTVIEAIESVLNQTECPFEIVVLDDCSKDKTAELASSHLSKQQGFKNWKVVQNPINLGIPQNTKKITSVIAGNVVTHLSGDDRLSEKTIERTNTVLKTSGLDPESDFFISVSPVKHYHGENTSVVHYKLLKNNLFKSAIVKTFPFVKVGCSVRLMRMAEYPSDIGLWGDWAWDVEICSKPGIRFYLIDEPLYLYSVGLGVGSKALEIDLLSSYLKAAVKIYEKHKDRLDLFDKAYLYGDICYLQGKINNRVFYSMAGVFFFIINTLIHRNMTLFKSTLIRYIPYSILKKVLG